MNNSGNNGFCYHYSAKDLAELKRIREKYVADTKPIEPDTMEQIRRLDSSVTKEATVVALIFGIVGILIMGFGMSLVMSELKEMLRSHKDMALLIGIMIGFVGMIGVFVAYPLYQHVAEKERKRIAPEILRLTDELMEEGK